jgi:hypothetical protein
LRLDNLRLGGALRWKTDDRWLRRPRSAIWKAGTAKVVAPPPPPMSVKGRWVGPVSKY